MNQMAVSYQLWAPTYEKRFREKDVWRHFNIYFGAKQNFFPIISQAL